MKKLIYILFVDLFLVTVMFSQNTKNIQQRIELKYVNSSILTPITVDCNDFDTYFLEFNTQNIYDTLQICDFLNTFYKLTPDSSEIDVRMKIKLYYKKMYKEFCVGNFTIESDEGIFTLSDNLRKIILYWIDNKQKKALQYSPISSTYSQ